jgi:GTPase SAR1 family protein
MELTLSEIKPILKYIIENNKTLQDNGDFPIAVNLVGDAGCGKTSTIYQLAKEIGANYIKLNLAQISEPSDIVGWPLREHYVCRQDPNDPENEECKWITPELIDAFTKAGWQITEETRMSYAIPYWLKNIDENKPTILVLDDYSRAQPAVLQAVMEIICRQEYISWRLPKNSHVICSSNPDDGSYNVNSLDEAFSSRLLNFNVKFDPQSWAAWAENHGLDGRGINFLLSYHHELMDRSKTKVAKVNARNYTMFINTISGIKDWSNSKSLATILQIASGCFLDEDDIVGGLFAQFVANKLDKLLSPEDLVTKDWSYVKGVLKSQLYDGDMYRADIASIVTTRFVNYSLKLFSTKGTKTEIVVNRILDIIDNDETLLTEDLIFNLVKTLNKAYPARCNKLLLNPKIAKKLL